MAVTALEVSPRRGRAGPGQTAGRALVAEACVREDRLSVAGARLARGLLIKGNVEQNGGVNGGNVRDHR